MKTVLVDERRQYVTPAEVVDAILTGKDVRNPFLWANLIIAL